MSRRKYGLLKARHTCPQGHVTDQRTDAPPPRRCKRCPSTELRLTREMGELPARERPPHGWRIGPRGTLDAGRLTITDGPR